MTQLAMGKEIYLKSVRLEWMLRPIFYSNHVPATALPPISSDPTAHELVNLPARIRPNYTGTFPVNVKEFYSLLLSDASDDFWREYHTKDGLSGRF